jgi:hypothetical protein
VLAQRKARHSTYKPGGNYSWAAWEKARRNDMKGHIGMTASHVSTAPRRARTVLFSAIAIAAVAGGMLTGAGPARAAGGGSIIWAGPGVFVTGCSLHASVHNGPITLDCASPFVNQNWIVTPGATASSPHEIQLASTNECINFHPADNSFILDSCVNDPNEQFRMDTPDPYGDHFFVNVAATALHHHHNYYLTSASFSDGAHVVATTYAGSRSYWWNG